MVNIETKIETIMRCLAAETEEDREQARAELRGMMDCSAVSAGSEQEDAERVIDDVLFDLGVTYNLKGRNYLVTAIQSVLNEPDIMYSITTALYPTVASAHNTTAPRVERSIRTVIESAWDHCDSDTLHGYFGNSISKNKGKPTNSEFISRVAYLVRKRMKEVRA